MVKARPRPELEVGEDVREVRDVTDPSEGELGTKVSVGEDVVE
jgi:hypothetical protein